MPRAGVRNKCLAGICGTPMLVRVIDALRTSERGGLILISANGEVELSRGPPHQRPKGDPPKRGLPSETGPNALDMVAKRRWIGEVGRLVEPGGSRPAEIGEVCSRERADAVVAR